MIVHCVMSFNLTFRIPGLLGTKAFLYSVQLTIILCFKKGKDNKERVKNILSLSMNAVLIKIDFWIIFVKIVLRWSHLTADLYII